MKRYQSTEEGIWKEILKIDFREEYEILRQMIQLGDHESAIMLSQSIKNQREKDVTDDIVTQLQAFYNSKKPDLLNGQIYQLISIDIVVDSGSYTGIINCRIDGNHIQIR